MTISIVVPLYNEAQTIEELYKRLSQVVKTLATENEIIFVDDGSQDDTVKKLSVIAKQDKQVKLVQLARNFGQTAALAAGIDQSCGDIIVTLDGDLQHAPEEIPRFIAKLNEGFDLVSGWRETRTDEFLTRKLPSQLANSLMRYLSGVPVKDFGSTFKAYRAPLLKSLELFGELHRFIPVLAGRIGAKICEIPITVHPRAAGISNYGLSRSFGVFEDLIFLEFYTNYLTKPIRAFGKLFFLFFGSGFSISAVLMLLWLIGSIQAVWQHSALLLFSLFLMTIGIQFLVVGILAELLTRIYHHTSSTKIYTIRSILKFGE